MLEISSDAQDVAAAMRSVGDSLRSGELIGAAVEPLTERWATELSARAVGAQDQRAIVDGATALVEKASLLLEASASTVPLSGGLVPATQGGAVEFGSTHPGLPAPAGGGRIAVPTARELGEQYVELADTALETAYRDAVGDS